MTNFHRSWLFSSNYTGSHRELTGPETLRQAHINSPRKTRCSFRSPTSSRGAAREGLGLQAWRRQSDPSFSSLHLTQCSHPQYLHNFPRKKRKVTSISAWYVLGTREGTFSLVLPFSPHNNHQDGHVFIF